MNKPLSSLSCICWLPCSSEIKEGKKKIGGKWVGTKSEPFFICADTYGDSWDGF